MDNSSDSSKAADAQHKMLNTNFSPLKDISLQDVPSFVKTIAKKSFSMPNLPNPHVALSFSVDPVLPLECILPESDSLSAADSGILKAKIISAKRLTANDGSVKKTLELVLKLEEEKVNFTPGDAFGFICCNPFEEVSFLLKRLGMADVADDACEVGLLKTCNPGKRPPVHIPSTSTLRHILSFCVDLRSVPKKVLIRILAKHTADESDRISLELLSSHEGLFLFKECIQKPALCVLDLLEVFKSCNPPIERLLEHLPPLRPRFYSVASSPLVSDETIRIIFNVMKVEKTKHHTKERKGICTGWLDSITEDVQSTSETDPVELLESGISHLSMKQDFSVQPMPSIFIYKRVNKHFFLPENPSTPIIMVGPGTGVAPFLGFLQHREQQMSASKETSFGETWLFYGCRYKDKDFLYSDELERLRSKKVLTHLSICFSRDKCNDQAHPPRRVQDNIILHSKNLMKVIESGGVIYVCGDARGMSRDVWNAFIDIYKMTKSCSDAEARSYLLKLDKEKRYLVDVW